MRSASIHDRRTHISSRPMLRETPLLPPPADPRITDAATRVVVRMAGTDAPMVLQMIGLVES